MKIEDVTASALREATDRDLRDVRFRFVQLHDRYFSDPAVVRKGDLTKGDCLRRYVLLRREMTRRGMALNSSTAIDREVEGRIAKKALLDLDVPGLEEVVLAESVVVVTGAFLSNPKKADSIDLTLTKIARTPSVETRLASILRSETGKAATFSYGAEEPSVSHVPLYDLVLRARPVTERVSVRATKGGSESVSPSSARPVSDSEIAAAEERAKKAAEEWATIQRNRRTQEGRMKHKFVEARVAVDYDGATVCLVCGGREPVGGLCPGSGASWEEAKTATEPTPGMTAEVVEKVEVGEKTIRVPAAPLPEGHKVRTIDISAPKGIKALYDVEGKRIVTYLFEREKWTRETAVQWVADHKVAKDAAVEKMVPGRFEIYKIEESERIVGGVIYEPNVEDTQGDFTDKEEIRKAMFRFMEGYFRQQARIKVMHKGKSFEFPILECFQPETDVLKGGKTVRAGAWWMMIRVEDETIWNDIASGSLTGFSMGGRAATEG